MNTELTKDQYLEAFNAMDRKPILGDQAIGKLKINVGVKRWLITDDHDNRMTGTVRTGPATRFAVREALVKWLDNSGIR